MGEYVATGMDDYITMLQGSENATTLDCRYWVQSFVEQDEMLKAFRDGDCQQISEKVREWNLITGLYWGFMDWKNDISGGEDFKKEWEKYTSVSQVPPQDVEHRGYHDYFTRALLMEVLIQLRVLRDSNYINFPKNVEWL